MRLKLLMLVVCLVSSFCTSLSHAQVGMQRHNDRTSDSDVKDQGKERSMSRTYQYNREIGFGTLALEYLKQYQPQYLKGTRFDGTDLIWSESEDDTVKEALNK